LYVQIKGEDAFSFLDALHKRHRFEERPLIWKAHILREQGKLDEAEAAAKAAIAIDPSDGEQGRGLRMRVYHEMGEIQRAKGDAEQSKFFKGVMKAIRLSEDADRLHEHGLLKRAIGMYEEALGYFADAYCIQSRIAVQLEEIGDYEAAESHYRRAYELMPDSFGRVESHCFGCEGVFSSDRAQGVADRVFTSLVKANPDKPQVHYLLGYLREMQGRDRDALPLYRQAVALDPDYLNAWKHLGGLGSSIQLKPEDLDDVAINQIRLDPLGRSGRANAQMVWDLSRLWQALVEAQAFSQESPDSLLAMPASASRLEERKSAAETAGLEFHDESRYRRYEDRHRAITTGHVFTQHAIISQLIQLLQQVESMRPGRAHGSSAGHFPESEG
jgi:tetratricopeptide (TPR) repeat protein